VYVIEENPKIFNIIKKILQAKNDEKNIYLYGGSDFNFNFDDADLLILGKYENHRKKIDIADFGNIKSVLLNIENSRGINYSDKNAQIITCGLKAKDTFVFSSINLDEGTVILELQRSVKNINGATLEPFEKQISVPAAIKKETSEDLILSLAALVFCGRL
jgi:hypothetical protein